jgi:hypothetical protein
VGFFLPQWTKASSLFRAWLKEQILTNCLHPRRCKWQAQGLQEEGLCKLIRRH